MEKFWFVYIVHCADESFYTGITNNLEKRIAIHNTGKGAKYTKPRRPVHLVYSEKVENKSSALRREIAIKKMSHFEKLHLCKIDENQN